MESFGLVLLLGGVAALGLAFVAMVFDSDTAVMILMPGGMAAMVFGLVIAMIGNAINGSSECTAMWRAGNRSVTAVAPVPVIVPRAR